MAVTILVFLFDLISYLIGQDTINFSKLDYIVQWIRLFFFIWQKKKKKKSFI